MKKSLPWIVFDFDGTIVDTKKIFIPFYNKEIAKKYRCKSITESDFMQIRTLSHRDKMKALGINFFKLPFIVHQSRKAFPKYIKHLPVVEGMKELFDQLIVNGFQLAILSSNKKNNIESFLKYQGISDRFQTIICDKGLSFKVKHKTIKQFLKSNSLSSNNMIYVGDEERDVHACRRVGVSVFSVSWGLDDKKNLQKHNHELVADSPEQLFQMIQAHTH